MTDSDRRALAVSALLFGVATPAVYVAMRVYDYSRGRVSYPVVVVETPHIEYFWRISASLWFGLAVAVIGFWLLRTADERRVDRVLDRTVKAGAVLIAATVIGAWVFP